MNRQDKQLVIESIKKDFENSQASFLIGTKGLTVEAIQSFRKGLYSQGGQLKVAKNTLLKLAINEVEGLSDLSPYFKDQIAIVFASKESPTIAKIIAAAAKQNQKFVIIAGSLNDKVINKSQVEFLASLPTKEILLAHVCGTLKAPISGFVSIMSQLILRLLWVLNKAAEKQQ
jgi:large subunit ribosomal protein L10